MNVTTRDEAEESSRVYRETTLPIMSEKPQLKTKKRRDKSDLGDNFIAPDGGWAWLVCVAAGVSNLSIYPCLQQFGFLFREYLAALGLTSSEITTIINTNSAISSCSGLLNGPMFRRYTFRQVGLAGSLFIFIGIMITAFSDTFSGFMFSYSLLYGFGMGISVSASSLAINTYFKNKRRHAAGFSWTVTGLGPIFFPHVVTFLLAIYGVRGTVIIFAGISLHSMMCALVYQPVHYHAPMPEETKEINAIREAQDTCKFCELQKTKDKSIFSSQYLYQDDDQDMPGYEITEPGTPMLSRANDGWFGSKLSLASGKLRFRRTSTAKDLEDTWKKPISEEVQSSDANEAEFLKPNNFNRERDETMRYSSTKQNLASQRPQRTYSDNQLRCTCAQQLHNELKNLNNNERLKEEEDLSISTSNFSFLQKVVAFFDLDLLRDFTYVNLVVGLTIINFGELNFSILTPFILNDFGLDTAQITFATSVLGSLDLVVRFLVPFITEKIPWDNRVFFLIGVVGIALGRTVVACTRSYPVILTCFVWIGMCKGVRTIFWPLILPGYVPLKRLPAASGLQLLITGLFTLAAGPLVGLIRDRFNYAITLHCLNMLSFIGAISWTLEALIRRHYSKMIVVQS